MKILSVTLFRPNDLRSKYLFYYFFSGTKVSIFISNKFASDIYWPVTFFKNLFSRKGSSGCTVNTTMWIETDLCSEYVLLNVKTSKICYMPIIVIRYQCIYIGTQKPVEIHTWQATKSWSRYTTCVKIFRYNKHLQTLMWQQGIPMQFWMFIHE